MLEGRSILGIAGATIAAVIGFTSAAQRNDAGEITAAGSVDAFEVQVGDCFDDEVFEQSEISDIPAVPCSQPHDNEIYALFDIQGNWPGDERVEELAYEGCLERFPGVIGKAYDESEIDYTVMYPTEGSWTQRNDREVICIAYHMEYEKLTGTVRGSAR